MREREKQAEKILNTSKCDFTHFYAPANTELLINIQRAPSLIKNLILIYIIVALNSSCLWMGLKCLCEVKMRGGGKKLYTYIISSHETCV